MIWNALLDGFFNFFELFFFWLPEVTIADIPYYGSGISANLTEVVHTWNSFMETFPYAEVGFTMFLWVVIPTELLLLVAKIILGHRVPVNSR